MRHRPSETMEQSTATPASSRRRGGFDVLRLGRRLRRPLAAGQHVLDVEGDRLADAALYGRHVLAGRHAPGEVGDERAEALALTLEHHEVTVVGLLHRPWPF